MFINITRHRKRSDGVMIVLLSLTAVSGCSTPGASDTLSDSTTTEAASSQIESNDGIGSPLQAKARQVNDISTAAVIAQATKCMAESGFEFRHPFDTEPPLSFVSVVPWHPQTVQSWLHPDAELFDRAPSTSAPATTPEYSQKLWGNHLGSWEADTENSVAYQGQLLGGEIYDGCFPTAQTEIIGGGEPSKMFVVEEILDLFDSVELEAFSALVADREFLDGVQAWEACMASGGYRILQDAEATFFTADPLSANQEDAAVARYNECLTESKLTEIGDRLYPTYREAATARLIGDGSEFEAELDAVAERSNDVLSN